MTALEGLLARLAVALVAPPPRDDRGDVPGWVLITVMSAGLVAMLYQLAGDELRQMLRAALNKVS